MPEETPEQTEQNNMSIKIEAAKGAASVIQGGIEMQIPDVETVGDINEENAKEVLDTLTTGDLWKDALKEQGKEAKIGDYEKKLNEAVADKEKGLQATRELLAEIYRPTSEFAKMEAEYQPSKPDITAKEHEESIPEPFVSRIPDLEPETITPSEETVLPFDETPLRESVGISGFGGEPPKEPPESQPSLPEEEPEKPEELTKDEYEARHKRVNEILNRTNSEWEDKIHEYYPGKYGKNEGFDENELETAKRLIEVGYGEKRKVIDGWHREHTLEEAQRVYFDHLIDKPDLIKNYPIKYHHDENNEIIIDSNFYLDLRRAFTGWGKENGGEPRRKLFGRLKKFVDLKRDELNSLGIDTSVLGIETETSSEKSSNEEIEETKRTQEHVKIEPETKQAIWDRAYSNVLEDFGTDPYTRTIELQKLLGKYQTAPKEWRDEVRAAVRQANIESGKELPSDPEALVLRMRERMINAINSTTNPDTDRIAREIGLIVPYGDITKARFPNVDLLIEGSPIKLEKLLYGELQMRVNMAKLSYERYATRQDYDKRLGTITRDNPNVLTVDNYVSLGQLGKISYLDRNGETSVIPENQQLAEAVDMALAKFISIAEGNDSDVRILIRDKATEVDTDMGSNLFGIDASLLTDRHVQKARNDIRRYLARQLWLNESEAETNVVIKDAENLAWQYVWASDLPDKYTVKKITIKDGKKNEDDYLYGYATHRLTHFGQWREFQARQRQATYGSLRLLFEYDRGFGRNQIDAKQIYNVFSTENGGISTLIKTSWECVPEQVDGLSYAKLGRFFRDGSWDLLDRSPIEKSNTTVIAGNGYLEQVKGLNAKGPNDINAGYFGEWNGKIFALVGVGVIDVNQANRQKMEIAKDVFWKFSSLNPNNKNPVSWGTMEAWVRELTRYSHATPGYFDRKQVGEFRKTFLSKIQKQDAVKNIFYGIGSGILDYLSKSVK